MQIAAGSLIFHQSREDPNLLWRVAAREDSRIEPIPCGSIERERSRESAIIEAGRREGIKVAVE